MAWPNDSGGGGGGTVDPNIWQWIMNAVGQSISAWSPPWAARTQEAGPSPPTSLGFGVKQYTPPMSGPVWGGRLGGPQERAGGVYGGVTQIEPTQGTAAGGLTYNPLTGEPVIRTAEDTLAYMRVLYPGLSDEEILEIIRRKGGLVAAPQARPSQLEYWQFAADEAWRRLQQANAAKQLGYSYASMAQSKALQQQQMAQQAELARLQREQQQREMAAAIGRTIAQAQSQQWAQGLGYELPRGTQHAPGFEAGGPVGALYNMAGLQYQPQRITPSPGPSKAEMEAWLEDAIKRFGP